MCTHTSYMKDDAVPLIEAAIFYIYDRSPVQVCGPSSLWVVVARFPTAIGVTEEAYKI